MADDNYRSHRSRDPRDFDPAASDPLAELARLIGQGDPYAERERHQDDHAPGPQYDDTVAPGLDWAAGDEYEAQERARDPYAPSLVPPPPLPPAVPSPPAGYDDEPPPVSDRFFSGPAAKFNGFREDEPHGAHDQTAYADEPAQHGDVRYAEEEYYDEPRARPRRTGVIVVMAVLGLAVVGVSGAFAYRAMFGGYVLPSLPPIIKATSGPNKIMPSYGKSQGGNANQLGSGSSSATEKMVSREEQPVNMEAPKVNSRVVSTIPMASSQNPPTAGAVPMPSDPTAPGAPPMIGNPQPGSAFGAAPSATMTAPATVPASQPAASSTEPKKVHTVTIRGDQAAGADAMPAPGGASAAPPMPAARPAARPAAQPRPVQQAVAQPAGGNAPMSIVPGADGNVAASAPSRSRAGPQTVAAAGGSPTTVASSSSGTGGYAVQLTSQRSEADAQSAYQALQAKFPGQLGSRQAVIRRADLGPKGVFYRAMVGPFASMDEAAGVCSSLKAAGGTCLVQRN